MTIKRCGILLLTSVSLSCVPTELQKPQLMTLKEVSTIPLSAGPSSVSSSVNPSHTPPISANKKPSPQQDPANFEPAPSEVSSPIFQNTDFVLPEQFKSVHQIVLDMPSNYLNTNASQQLRVLLKDAQGKTLFLSDPPFTYQSSRPEDISITELGELKTLKPVGFSEITVMLKGSTHKASRIFTISQTVNSASGGGGGGGSSTPVGQGTTETAQGPVEKIRARLKFQF